MFSWVSLFYLHRRPKIFLKYSVMGFWTNNPCSPTWFGLVSSWATSHPPLLLETNPPLFPIHPIRGCTFGLATEEDIQQIAAFWESWFSKSRCSITESRIRASHAKGLWDICVARHGSRVIGTIVRRWVHGLHVKGAYIPKAGIIDFLCVHPAWKKKGVGRTLICLVQNAAPRPFPPHLMLWETYIPSIPPAVVGSYWKKECVVGKRDRLSEEEERGIWSVMKEGRTIWSDYARSDDMHIYSVGRGAIVIWNTWHRRVPEGDYIGIVLAATAAEAVREFVTCSPFGLLLADTKYEGWEWNGPFQWGLYNMNIGCISTQMPLLVFN